MSEKIAKVYLAKLNKVLRKTKTKAVLIGATALKISGKKDLDFGVYISEEKWDEVLIALINYFEGIGNLNSGGFARFNSTYRGYEVEVVVIRGASAERDKNLLSYLKKHPKLVREYEKVKHKSAHSERAYMLAKNDFLNKVIGMIPEGKKK